MGSHALPADMQNSSPVHKIVFCFLLSVNIVRGLRRLVLSEGMLHFGATPES